MKILWLYVCFSSVQLFSCVRLFATPWTTARQASLSISNSQSLLKLMSIELVMPSSHLFLCRPLFLLPPIPPSIRVFSNESTLHMRWPKNWSFSVSISPSNEHKQYWSITEEVWVFLILSVQIVCFNVVKCHFFKIRRWLLYTQYVIRCSQMVYPQCMEWVVIPMLLPLGRERDLSLRALDGEPLWNSLP